MNLGGTQIFSPCHQLSEKPGLTVTGFFPMLCGQQGIEEAPDTLTILPIQPQESFSFFFFFLLCTLFADPLLVSEGSRVAILSYVYIERLFPTFLVLTFRPWITPLWIHDLPHTLDPCCLCHQDSVTCSSPTPLLTRWRMGTPLLLS